MMLLPPSITAAMAVLPPMPLDQRPPMHYRPLEDLAKLRAQNPHPILPVSPLELLDQVVEHPYCTSAVGLLYLGHGLVDECHALVTPLSWPEATTFSYGPPLSTEADAVASYAHLLVHRWEGSHVGELSMPGYTNAHYWGRATKAKAAGGGLPLDTIRSNVQALIDADRLSSAARAAGRAWLDEWIVGEVADGSWEPRALTELCKLAEQGQVDASLREFGSHACLVELRTLVEYCWQQAGYRIETTNQASTSVRSRVAVDDEQALRAANKVSSAHMSNFASGGSIVLRQIVKSPSSVFGLACRLLQAPACRRSDQGSLHVFVAESEMEVVQGIWLAPGDVYVCMHKPAAADLTWQTYQACEPQEADYVDSLYGTRGETPTTVVQWSKGTIF